MLHKLQTIKLNYFCGAKKKEKHRLKYLKTVLSYDICVITVH